MSLLQRIIFAEYARSTHHKLALDALPHLQGPNAHQWSELLLSEYGAYLQGAKAPDDTFKDFKNHVLHVRDNFWGGAVAAAEHWYGQLVDHLRGSEWKEGAYAAGVLSHYCTDPLMPFHTGQTEAEGAVHRAAEWSVTTSYDRLRDMIPEVGGYPKLNDPAGPQWLTLLIREGATFSNQFYDLLIDHYDLAVGVKNPPAGLDRVAQEAIASCLAYATVAWAIVLQTAFAEAAVTPPAVDLSAKEVIASSKIPIRKLINKLADKSDRQAVEAIYKEVLETGKAIESLPESERLVRQFHAAEVLKVPLAQLNAEKPRPAGTCYGRPADAKPQPTATTTSTALLAAVARAAESPPPSVRLQTPRFYLNPEDDIVDAPSIGPKTATRFQQIGMHTVRDLLNADPELTAEQLATRHIPASVVRDWQDQSRLMINVAGLRGHDAQILVASGIRDRSALSQAEVHALLERVRQTANTPEGKRILRSGAVPDQEEVTAWITAARQPRTANAA
ncbi:MAG: DUF4332 domain-containing protein [Planctomycetaceae bacterium]